jgi:hypothetical protein
MDKTARQALATIRRCIAVDRVRLTLHFRVRLAERGQLWADVPTVVEAPSDVSGDGVDDAGRSRWILRGRAADGSEVGLVCAVGRDAQGELTVFITAVWVD